VTRGARGTLLGLCVVVLAELGGLNAVSPGPVITTGDPGSYHGTPADLKAAARRLGIPAGTVNRLQVRWGLPGGLHEPHAGFITAAYQQGHVYLAPGTNAVDGLGYEYLHDVWAHVADAQRSRLTELLNDFYAANHTTLEPALGGLVAADESNGATATSARLDELHSIACSRTRDGHLSQPLRAYCNYVLPGRVATTKTY
jgi:hypothetical protein